MADDVRDPAGAILRAGLAVLAAHGGGPMDSAAVRGALDELMRLQAVRVADAHEAIRILDEAGVSFPLSPDLQALALDLFARHRARIGEIRAAEVSRSGYVARRLRERRERQSPGEGRG